MASAASSRNPKDMFALKQKAMKYYSENGIPVKMEEILNRMFYDDPADVHGYLVNYFSQFTKPATLKKLCASQVFDSTGMSTIQTDVICTVNNLDKKVVSSTIPSTNIKAKPEDMEKAEVETQNSVVAAINAINTDIGGRLFGMNPKQQEEVDAILLSVIDKLKQEEQAKKAALEEEQPVEQASPTIPLDDKDKKKSAKKSAKSKELLCGDEGKSNKGSAPVVVIPDDPLEVFTPGSQAVAAVSQAVCACAAVANNLPIYRHVSNLARTKGALHEFRLPLPMVTIIQSGKFVPGKVNCVKEYMVVPGVAMPVEKSLQHIQHIYQYVAKSYATKMGPGAKFVNESGALCPQLESATQALDLLQEAINAQGLTIGEDMYLAINACGHDFFDHDKGRYEVTAGVFKTPDEMVDFWGDIVLKYPALVAIIDPVRGEDSQAWLKLGERVSDGVFIIGDRFYPRPGLVVETPPPLPIQTSGVVLYMEQMNSVTDLIGCCNMFCERKNEVVVSTNKGDTTDTFIVDFAVGLGARFLKVGGPCRGERSCKLNRLVEILQELEPPAEGADAAEAGEEGAGNHGKSEGAVEESENEDFKIDVGGVEEEGESARESDKVEEEKMNLGPLVWGENEPSRLKLHDPFVFPVIEVPPPPPENSEREGEEEKSVSPSSKQNVSK